jgi:hypothetical protein
MQLFENSEAPPIKPVKERGILISKVAYEFVPWCCLSLGMVRS